MLPRPCPAPCGDSPAQPSWVVRSGETGKRLPIHLGLVNWSFWPCCTFPSGWHSLKVPFGQYWITSRHAALWQGWCCSAPALQVQFISHLDFQVLHDNLLQSNQSPSYRPLLSVFRSSGSSSCRSLLAPWCCPGRGWFRLKTSPTSVWIHPLRETLLLKYVSTAW